MVDEVLGLKTGCDVVEEEDDEPRVEKSNRSRESSHGDAEPWV